MRTVYETILLTLNMAKFKITPKTTVADLKEQFGNEVGCVLRVYDGRSEAPDGANLVSLGAKEGELECRTSRTVGKFEEAFQDELNLKVKVYTKDNWVKVLDGITLATAGQLPNGMTKAKMEEHLSYQRDEECERIDESLSSDSSNQNNTDKLNEMTKEEQLALLEKEINKVLDYNVEDRIKKMFFDIIPNGTYIYSIDSDYENQNVAFAIDCAVNDYGSNCSRFVKAVKFKVEDEHLYAVEILTDDEDEIVDCHWNLNYFPANYSALSNILTAYSCGNHSEDNDVFLIPQCEAEEEEEED